MFIFTLLNFTWSFRYTGWERPSAQDRERASGAVGVLSEKINKA